MQQNPSEKLTGSQLVKKFPTFYGTRRFITAFTSARHLTLSWGSSIQSIHPHPISWRYILILSPHLCLGLPSGLLPSGFPTKTMYTPPIHATCPTHLILLDSITRAILGEQYKSLSSSLCSFLHSLVTSSLLGPIFSSTSYSPTPSPTFHPQYERPSFTPIHNGLPRWTKKFDSYLSWKLATKQLHVTVDRPHTAWCEYRQL